MQTLCIGYCHVRFSSSHELNDMLFYIVSKMVVSGLCGDKMANMIVSPE